LSTLQVVTDLLGWHNWVALLLCQGIITQKANLHISL